MTITPIYEQRPQSQEISEELVDIVAVHGIFEDDEHTWTEPTSKVAWLRDLLPKSLSPCRIVRYGYPVEAFTLPGVDSSKSILTHAQNLVAELCADRHLVNASNRPIIFVCHGFGGLLVKRALALSLSRVNPTVSHLRTIFTCTYGILFFGTPHAGINDKAIFLRETEHSSPSQFMLSLATGSQMLDEINDQFAPLMGRFSIYNFWESIRTDYNGQQFYVVEQESAAPIAHDVEKCGLSATHSGMTKFEGISDGKFMVVLEALSRYCQRAPGLIRMRRNEEAESVKKRRQQAADELYQPQIQPLLNVDAESPSYNQWSLIPRKSSTYFTGRQKHAQELRAMLGTIRKYDSRGTPKVVVIYGLGGSGKTQFCLKYAEDNKSKYWGVFWVDASSKKSLESGFAFIGTQLGRGPSMVSAIHWLSQCKEPWLLIIDNADDPEEDASSYFPSEGNGHVLITTRNPNAVEYATAGNHLRFRGMEPHDAISLLLKAAYPNPKQSSQPTTPGSWQLAEGIAVELGYLPLAITHAGATIRRNIYTLERYLKYYLPQRKKMLNHSRVKSVDEVNIITTWEIPFRKIVDRASIEHRDAVDLMHIFAFMHHESIPEHIFQRSWHILREPDFPLKHYPDFLQPVWNEEAQARFRRAIRVLCDHSIIDYEPSKGSCTMHPVVHNWARDRLDEHDQKRWLRCTMAILARCIATELEASRLSFRALLLPHIGSCLRFHESQPKSHRDTIHSAAEMELFAKVYAENGLWQRARRLQDTVIDIRVSSLGKGHEDTIRAKMNKSQSLWNLFEVKEAIKTQMEVLNLLRWRRSSFAEWTVWPIWNPMHTPYCIALGEITQSLWLAGQRSSSEHCGKRAVDGLIKRLGTVDPQALRVMFHLARTYRHVCKYEECSELLVWVLKLQKRFFGMDHPDTLMTRNELGMLLCERNKAVVAQKLVENVLNARKRILGEEHAYTLWSVNDLSKVYIKLDRSDEAVNMLESIIPIVKRTLGEKHVGMIMTLSNLGRAYFMSGRWEKAEETVRPLLDVIGKDHPDLLHNKYGYAQILYNLGKLDEAEVYCKEILDKVINSKILPLSDACAVGTADLLSMIYRDQGKEKEISKLEKKIPGKAPARNEDRVDPYGVRRGYKQHTPTPNAGARSRNDSFSNEKIESSVTHQKSRTRDPRRRLAVSRTF